MKLFPVCLNLDQFQVGVAIKLWAGLQFCSQALSANWLEGWLLPAHILPCPITTQLQPAHTGKINNASSKTSRKCRWRRQIGPCTLLVDLMTSYLISCSLAQWVDYIVVFMCVFLCLKPIKGKQSNNRASEAAERRPLVAPALCHQRLFSHIFCAFFFCHNEKKVTSKNFLPTTSVQTEILQMLIFFSGETF